MSDTIARGLGSTSPAPGDFRPRVRLSTTGAGEPATCETTQLVTLIGGRRDCHLPVNDPEVSKVHAAIVCTGRELLVCDLCSRTGTFVNNRPVRTAALNPGDALRVGTVELALQFLASAAGQTTQKPDQPAPVMLHLASQTFDLSRGPLIIGRRTICDLCLDTPDVSLTHALVFAYRDRPAVFDLGSRSGTFVNQRRVRQAPLHHGDRLTIGGVTLEVECPGIAADGALDAAYVAAEEAAPGGSRSPAAHDRDRDKRAPEPARRVLRDNLAALQRQLEQRALDLDRRAAELDTLATLLELERDHLERLRADVARRETELEQAETEARERLALALAHEQAVTAAWEELDRWHARHARANKRAPAPQTPPAKVKAAPDVAPLPAPGTVARPDTAPPGSGAGLGNV